MYGWSSRKTNQLTTYKWHHRQRWSTWDQSWKPLVSPEWRTYPIKATHYKSVGDGVVASSKWWAAAPLQAPNPAPSLNLVIDCWCIWRGWYCCPTVVIVVPVWAGNLLHQLCTFLTFGTMRMCAREFSHLQGAEFNSCLLNLGGLLAFHAWFEEGTVPHDEQSDRWGTNKLWFKTCKGQAILLEANHG